MAVRLVLFLVLILCFNAFGFNYKAAADNLYTYKTMVIQGKKVPIQANAGQLNHFLQAVKNAKSKNVRIAHYGDSMILGDVISSDLREELQNKFGGDGIGYLSIYADDNKMKQTVIHTLSSDWKIASIFKRNPNKWPLGINGTVTMPGNNSWVKFESTKFKKSSRTFQHVKLYYSDANTGAMVKYTFNNGAQQTVSLKQGSKLQETVISHSGPATSVKLEFVNATNTYVYGASLEAESGIYVDNFPIKGNSGISLLDIPEENLKDFDKLMNYKLVILNFGVNVASPEYLDYDWYENKMKKVIEHFKKSMPNTSFLLVSAGDKSIKKGSRFITDPHIQKVIKAQKDVAEKTGIGFWNMFEAMGGDGSMNEWVNAGPPLALKDYTHLTSDGGKIIAELLAGAILSAR